MHLNRRKQFKENCLLSLVHGQRPVNLEQQFNLTRLSPSNLDLFTLKRESNIFWTASSC